MLHLFTRLNPLDVLHFLPFESACSGPPTAPRPLLCAAPSAPTETPPLAPAPHAPSTPSGHGRGCTAPVLPAAASPAVLRHPFLGGPDLKPHPRVRSGSVTSSGAFWTVPRAATLLRAAPLPLQGAHTGGPACAHAHRDGATEPASKRDAGCGSDRLPGILAAGGPPHRPGRGARL